VALGLGLVAEEELPGCGLLVSHPLKALGQADVAVLQASDFEILGEIGVQQGGRMILIADGEIEASGEEAGLERGSVKKALLGDGEALEGEEFLRVDGLVSGDEIGLEMGDRLEVFEPSDGEDGSGEAVLAGVLSGAGLALGGARSGGVRGIGAIGGELFIGDGVLYVGIWHIDVL